MSQTQTIEIRLPEDREFSEADRAILSRACEALAGLTCRPQGEPAAQVRAMTAQGWRVRYGLTWHAQASRDHEYEEACGETPAEALCKLCQLLGLHSIEGCP